MDPKTFSTRDQLQKWADKFSPEDRRFAFRGQEDSKWPLQTRLARHFLEHAVKPDE